MVMAMPLNSSLSSINVGGPINTSRPIAKAEVQTEVVAPAVEQVTLSGSTQAPPETPPPPGPALVPPAIETPLQAPTKHYGLSCENYTRIAPSAGLAGSGVANGQGGTLLMTETPVSEHSSSIDGFLAKFATPASVGPAPTRTPDLAALKSRPKRRRAKYDFPQ